ncbi:beta-N-acetylhexosaminidase [Rubrivirga sp. S365]|uniref:beta-N-acetylhexosaminidase n=1 Tax=Rubrivirga litoralis TaxID=3075598 RepID=A0ABU3BLI8_9BACT|nr:MULTISPECIES: beta-N-acetylhexosaminidase [unclassified Rubrivirga]MDT0630153.1 beta-N-acetylhexosaminidase [Rubrivirga sp. F394]MDT7855664.1 beta-N-acetylhexosaminidase [Rubrivirga sp. S365]
MPTPPIAQFRPALAFPLGVVLCLLLAAGGAVAQPAILPAPVEAAFSAGSFVVTTETPIVVPPGDAEAARVGQLLDELIGPAVDGAPAVDAGGAVGAIVLDRRPDRTDLGAEGYELEVTDRGVTITAPEAAGLFYGAQTLRHLMPPHVEFTAALPRPLPVPLGRVVDRPRFAWRGAMLDVARHFFSVDDVKRFVDLMALYKLNRLHLHLSDDQGWRVEIPGRPALTDVGGRTEVGDGQGGYYTVADYAEIVRYAAERFVVVVPEIDVPGHTNAALASLPELTCDGVAPAPYTGIRVGFSAVCVEKEETYAFLDDVVGALARATPGPYLHLGGDEVKTLSAEQYAAFMARAQQIVAAHGKRFVGWDEVAEVPLQPGAVVQVWRPQAPAVAASVAEAVAGGAAVVLSPSDRIYLDMKPDSAAVLGLTWAGLNGVRDSYDWDPAALLPGVPEASVLGIEAPLWSETLGTLSDVTLMAFPRLAAVAELAWSPQAVRSWPGVRRRLAAQAPRWTALGVTFDRSAEVPWER